MTEKKTEIQGDDTTVKKRRIGTSLLLAAGILGVGGAGFLFGQGAREPDIVVAAQKDQGDAEESTRIAVVNLDEGVQGSVGRTNYAQSLSQFPGADYEYASLEEARSGFNAGTYGAYIIIPATFSQSVESINSAPQPAYLEYAVNRSYSGKAQYELLYNVVSYTKNLNDNITYMYLNNILTEFHTAQDGAVSVMQNDLRDKDAIDRIEPYDLVALVEAPELRREENTTETLDISEYTEANTELAQSIDDQYMLCVTEIQQEIETLEESGKTLSDLLTGLSEQVAEIDLTVDDQGVSIAETADAALEQALTSYVEGAPDKDELQKELQSVIDANNSIKENLNASITRYNTQLRTEFAGKLTDVLRDAALNVPELTVTEAETNKVVVTLNDSGGQNVPELIIQATGVSEEETLMRQIAAALAQSAGTTETVSVPVVLSESAPGAGDAQELTVDYQAEVSVGAVLKEWDDEATRLGYASAEDFLAKYGSGDAEGKESRIEISGNAAAFSQYIKDKVNSTDTASYSISGMTDAVYDSGGNPVLDDGGRPAAFSSLISGVSGALDTMKQGLADANELDITSVRQLVKDEYMAPVEANAQAAKQTFIQRNEEEKGQIALYNDSLAQFQPQINTEFVVESISGISENSMKQQQALTENNMAYMEYADKVFQAAEENVSALQEHIQETKESSDKAVTDALSEAKGVKAETSGQNQQILDAFSKKLPYTRLGSAEYTQTYQFIASPVNTEDASVEKPRQAAASVSSATVQRGEEDSQAFPWTAVSAAGGVLVLILAALLVWNGLRRKHVQ